MGSPDRIVILGGGAAASTVGTYLAREGKDVVAFHQPGDRDILVGESLVPGVIPLLRELGVEQDVESFSHLKPGAGFVLRDGTDIEFTFDSVSDTVEDYAYNVPRREFNQTMRETAREAGVRFVQELAGVEANHDQLSLADPTHERAGDELGGEPEFVIDATGRARVVANLLDLPAWRGNRTDTALFTHFDSLPGCEDGTVYTDIHEYGWNWRIPLPDRTSFGAVVDTDYLEKLGDDPKNQLDRLREEVDHIGRILEGATRQAPIYSFDNYQMVSDRMIGPNWALVGDAAGFVDPVFATGVYLGMSGAKTLAQALLDGTESALGSYEQTMQYTYQTWVDIIERYYNGRLMTLLQTGEEVKDTWYGSLINGHMEKNFGRIFTGRAAESSYGVWLLKFMCNYGLRNNDPATNRIRSKS